MSYTTIHYVYCDGEDCGDAGAAYTAPLPNGTVADQRELLRQEGWKVGQFGGTDYCPACWVEMQKSGEDAEA